MYFVSKTLRVCVCVCVFEGGGTGGKESKDRWIGGEILNKLTPLSTPYVVVMGNLPAPYAELVQCKLGHQLFSLKMNFSPAYEYMYKLVHQNTKPLPLQTKHLQEVYDCT